MPPTSGPKIAIPVEEVSGLMRTVGFEAVRRVDGRFLRDVLSVWQRVGLTPFPAHADKVLLSMVRLRNRLAHSYLVENSRALTHADGRTMMIAELRWYSEAFMSMDVTMQRWIEQRIQHLVETLDNVKADYGPIIEQAVLDALRTNLAGMGISLPEPPRKQVLTKAWS